MNRPTDRSNDGATQASAAAAVVVPAEPRQRWRITYARDPIPSGQAGREVLDAWQACLVAAGLPVAGLDVGGGGRARIAFAAPLPASARADAELADLFLVERVPRWVVREAMEDRMPPGHRWLDAEDVWLGAPALASRVVAADWRIVLDPCPVRVEAVAAAARSLISATALPRVRMKGTTERRYDLRPLLAAIGVEGRRDAIALRVRTRFDAELGAGRPDEVVVALAEAVGHELTAASTVRERLILAGDGAEAP